MQFDSHPQGASPEALFVTFNTCPVTPLQNHTLPPGEEVQGESPELVLDAYSEGVVPHITAELHDPLVLVQPDGRDLGRKLTSKR
jgi:hypothetical protein